MSSRTFHLAAEHDRLTLAAALRRLLPDHSWSAARRLISGRRVQVNGNLCLDDERHVRAGDVIKLCDHALAEPPSIADVRLAYIDEHLVVVQKPAGLTTLRHREETDLPQRRKQLQPTLDELVPRLLAEHLGLSLPQGPSAGPARQRGIARQGAPTRRGGRRPPPDRRTHIFPVHRLDRDTSGVMVFARTRQAERLLIRMFARHAVQRAYVAVATGNVAAQTIDTWLVRDRGDGLRGSTPAGAAAEGARRAITHIRPMEQLVDYTIVECRLETGRTHQIRIHLAEIGHPLCGEKVYTHLPGQPPRSDISGAPRQALHAAELAFVHPLTQQPLRFRMPLPPDLRQWLLKLRRQPG
jgi:23S rRNA pseudouridine1911/1915/1917 synthase